MLSDVYFLMLLYARKWVDYEVKIVVRYLLLDTQRETWRMFLQLRERNLQNL